MFVERNDLSESLNLRKLGIMLYNFQQFRNLRSQFKFLGSEDDPVDVSVGLE